MNQVMSKDYINISTPGHEERYVIMISTPFGTQSEEIIFTKKIEGDNPKYEITLTKDGKNVTVNESDIYFGNNLIPFERTKRGIYYTLYTILPTIDLPSEKRLGGKSRINKKSRRNKKSRKNKKSLMGFFY